MLSKIASSLFKACLQKYLNNNFYKTNITKKEEYFFLCLINISKFSRSNLLNFVISKTNTNKYN